MEIDFCPRWLLDKFGIGRDSQADAGLLISSVSIFILIPVMIRVPHVCLGQWLFGIPCPGCGIMHSVLAVLRMNLKAAWNANAAGFLLAPYLLAQIFARALVLGSVVNRSVVARASRIGQYVVVVALSVVWCGRILNL